MTKEEILEKAISKAVANGWKATVGLPYIKRAVSEGNLEWMVRGFAYDHDFAKALWGESMYDQLAEAPGNYSKHHDSYPLNPFWALHADETGYNAPMWKYHLQQMVIDEDPIKYLGENLPITEQR